MKKMIIVICFIVAVPLFAACGGDKKADASQASAASERAEIEQEDTAGIKGEQQEAGGISVFVPEGYVLEEGSMVGNVDEEELQCNMQRETPSILDYFYIFTCDSEESATANISTTKEINSGEDCTITADNGEWKGCQYTISNGSDDVDCIYLYKDVDRRIFQVMEVGHAADSPELLAVLASIKIQ